MERIIINTKFHKSEILVGEKWVNFRRYQGGSNTVIITDSNILRLYGNSFGDIPFLEITPGENSKQLEIIDSLVARLLDLGIDRGGFILGIGGGVVCDIAGFLASVYMRGIRFGFVSTSLLSQVDASVGGKNGVNAGTVKNIIGTFRQPDFVICDPEMLKTLPDDEYLSGLAELVKHGVICDSGFFGLIEENTDKVIQRDTDFLTKLIARSVEIKAEVVREDETEKGKRMLLNFGHTFGHAIEAHTGMKHGFAVAAGMNIAADISAGYNMLKPEEKVRLSNLLNKLGIIRSYEISFEKMAELIAHDKKRAGDFVNFVMINRIGEAVISKIPVSDLLEKYRSNCCK